MIAPGSSWPRRFYFLQARTSVPNESVPELVAESPAHLLSLYRSHFFAGSDFASNKEFARYLKGQFFGAQSLADDSLATLVSALEEQGFWRSEPVRQTRAGRGR